MRRKPNYRFERADRDRAKQAKKEEKLKRQQDRTGGRDGETDLAPASEAEPEGSQA